MSYGTADAFRASFGLYERVSRIVSRLCGPVRAGKRAVGALVCLKTFKFFIFLVDMINLIRNTLIFFI